MTYTILYRQTLQNKTVYTSQMPCALLYRRHSLEEAKNQEADMGKASCRLARPPHLEERVCRAVKTLE